MKPKEEKIFEDNKICIREINENIRRVYSGEPLTRSLKELNCNCNFREEYNKFCLIQEGEPIDSKRNKRRLYQQRPYVKERNREYAQRPEIKEKRKIYQRKYRRRPEIKARFRKYYREYAQRPEIKEKSREYLRKYYHRPEVKVRKREYQRKRLNIPKSRWRVK
jgi:dipeptidase